MVLLMMVAVVAPLRLNDARDINVYCFSSDKGGRWRRGDTRRRQRWNNLCRRYISEMEVGSMVDESWQQRKCDGLVLDVCNMKQIQSTINTEH
jgi:hypothetical protein